jgi:hypothetical protein
MLCSILFEDSMPLGGGRNLAALQRLYADANSNG